jgi:pectinesterase
VIPSAKPYVVFAGQGADPTGVVITDHRANGTLQADGTTWGATGSASVTISGHDLHAHNLTFADSFDEAAHPRSPTGPRVAGLTGAERLFFDNVRLLGNRARRWPQRCDIFHLAAAPYARRWHDRNSPGTASARP